MRAAGTILCLLIFAPSVFPEEPQRSTVTETVDVELFLLDVTVTDRQREIVMGLTIDDFSLKIDDRKTPIATLDLDCPDLPRAEPPALDPGDPSSPWAAPDRPRRIVLALDYRHLERTQRIDVIDQLRAAIERQHGSREELMIVALADFLRIEQPFSTDRDEALATLDRMENDITLWEPPFAHLHDAATFEALLHLVDLLGTLEDDKVVVLFSNWPSSAAGNDSYYDALAARSARSRVSFYTVWTRGLTARGSSRRLARLAVETGGRFTERTNDLSLGYSRAQRDLSCRYTVGFYASGEDRERRRKIVLRVKRRGVRTFHHARFSAGEAETRRKQLAGAAIAWPERYVAADVSVELRPLRPLSRRRWELLLAVEDRSVQTGKVAIRTRVRRGNAVWRKFAVAERVPYTAIETYRLPAGSYEVAAILSRAGEAAPRSAVQTLELPALDESGWWLSIPTLMQVPSHDSPDLPEQRRTPVLAQSSALGSYRVVAQLCRHGSRSGAQEQRLTLELVLGAKVIYSADRTVTFQAGSRLQCHGLDEPLPELSAGAYSLRLRARGGDEETQATQSAFELIPVDVHGERGSNVLFAR